MKDTWASGAIELLKHAEEHIKIGSAFDRKIAFISIDNSVELIFKSYLSLPKRYFGENRPNRKELDDALNSFPTLLDLIEKFAGDKLDGIELNDIEHYHRIRNTLYHQGTGLSVEDEYVEMYNSIAKILLNRLFDVEITHDSLTNKAIYADILIGWSEIEKLIGEILVQRQIVFKKQFKWPIFDKLSIVDKDIMQKIKNIRIERNRIAHSDLVEKPIDNVISDIEYVKKALKKVFDEYANEHDAEYTYYPSVSVLKGRLTERLFFGPPGYGDDPLHDMQERIFVLIPNNPINVIRNETMKKQNSFDTTHLNVDEVQLNTSIEIDAFLEKEVIVTGVFFGAHTGHHKTPVLLDVNDINIEE